jgi:hypothetical protein
MALALLIVIAPFPIRMRQPSGITEMLNISIGTTPLNSNRPTVAEVC